MRRGLALVSALALVLSMASVVSARAPIRTEVHSTSLGCEELTGAPGTAFLGVSVNDDGTAEANLELWAGEPFAGPPDLSRNYEQPVTGSIAGDTLSATIPLQDAAGSPAGSATVVATLEAAGEPFAFEPFRDGNRWIKTTGTDQPLAVTGGTLTLTGGSFTLDAGNCHGVRTDAEVFETNPNAFVASFSEQGSACTVEDGGGATAHVGFYLEGSDVFVWTEVEEADGGWFFAEGWTTLVDGAGTIPLTVYNPDTGEPSGATGTIEVAFARNGERYSYTSLGYNTRFRASGELIDVEGSLSFTTGETFSLDPCVGFDGDSKRIHTNPQGPRPGGKAPANDLPSKASALRLSSQASANTRGAARDAEVPYDCLRFVDEDGTVYDSSAQHTVWYRVTGTGGMLTIDTTGSDFDTVVAVYTADGAGGYLPVADACVDDSPLEPVGFTLQTILSFPAAAGTTYYVQAGGFPASPGYGNLKLSIR